MVSGALQKVFILTNTKRFTLCKKYIGKCYYLANLTFQIRKLFSFFVVFVVFPLLSSQTRTKSLFWKMFTACVGLYRDF